MKRELTRETRRLQQSNRNSEAFAECFASHRERLTSLAEARGGPGRRLCVLGAGNSRDLDLGRLAERYAEIHLVDLDGEALQRAARRQPRGVRERLKLSSGVDLSGVLATLDAFRDLEVEPEQLARLPDAAVEGLVRRLGGGFDCVVSACVLSQMHLCLRRAMSERHPLFAALTYTLNLTHLTTLASLAAPGGCALLVSDVADDQLVNLRDLDAAGVLDLLRSLALSGDLYDAVDPMTLGSIVADSPSLSRALEIRPINEAWLWQISPQRTYLAYALELTRL